jgi:hypothetical protein
MKTLKKMFGGDGENSLLTDAALVGTGAYLARQNPNSSTMGIVATAGMYYMYFGVAILLLFIIIFIFAIVFGKRTDPPPADATNSASGTPPPKK